MHSQRTDTCLVPSSSNLVTTQPVPLQALQFGNGSRDCSPRSRLSEFRAPAVKACFSDDDNLYDMALPLTT